MVLLKDKAPENLAFGENCAKVRKIQCYANQSTEIDCFP